MSSFWQKVTLLFLNAGCALDAAVVEEQQPIVRQTNIMQGHGTMDSDYSKVIHEVQEVERAIARASAPLERILPDQLRLVLIFGNISSIYEG